MTVNKAIETIITAWMTAQPTLSYFPQHIEPMDQMEAYEAQYEAEELSEEEFEVICQQYDKSDNYWYGTLEGLMEENSFVEEGMDETAEEWLAYITKEFKVK